MSSADSRATPLAAVNIAAVTLAAIITALRCFVRIRLLKAFGLDDYLMVAAMVCFLEDGKECHILHVLTRCYV